MFIFFNHKGSISPTLTNTAIIFHFTFHMSHLHDQYTWTIDNRQCFPQPHTTYHTPKRELQIVFDLRPC